MQISKDMGYKPYNKGTGKLFENPILESLTRTVFWFPVSFYYLIAIIFFAYGVYHHAFTVFSVFSIFIGGFLSFTLFEYLTHRFIFHFHTETENEKKIQYTMHGVHHEYPRDKDRLVMPPVLSILIACFFFGLYYVLMGKFAFIFFPGFVTGYSTYLLIHYAVHALKPPKNGFKYLWKHHSLHHYAGDDYAFAVSFPFWDYVFGTMPKR